MIRRPPRSTRKESSAASDVYKRQIYYIGGVIICVYFNIGSIFLSRMIFHVTWYVVIYIFFISGILIFATTQRAFNKLYTESSCLVKEERFYSGQMNYPVPGGHVGPMPIAGRPAEIKYPLIQ
eukprot:TRINITY_DN119_c0_g1_i4.p1 TRINITY_DN119_c0_g1~~TRINITY_DN119_c0_g1_i4.p1  ORF type:complete len:130 (-),score=23.06 TRINITY_DN119_c0_g1_i4:130-498(-)